MRFQSNTVSQQTKSAFGLNSILVLAVITISSWGHTISLMEYPTEMGHIAETTLHG